MRSLIDIDTGEIDHHVVNESAYLRACQQYGGRTSPPPAYIRDALSWCNERAHAERLQWRDHHGLPREDVLVPFHSLAPDTNE